MVTGGAVCSNWAYTESVRGEVSDDLPYLDPMARASVSKKHRCALLAGPLSHLSMGAQQIYGI